MLIAFPGESEPNDVAKIAKRSKNGRQCERGKKKTQEWIVSFSYLYLPFQFDTTIPLRCWQNIKRTNGWDDDQRFGIR